MSGFDPKFKVGEYWVNWKIVGLVPTKYSRRLKRPFDPSAVRVPVYVSRSRPLSDSIGPDLERAVLERVMISACCERDAS